MLWGRVFQRRQQIAVPFAEMAVRRVAARMLIANSSLKAGFARRGAKMGRCVACRYQEMVNSTGSREFMGLPATTARRLPAPESDMVFMRCV